MKYFYAICFLLLSPTSFAQGPDKSGHNLYGFQYSPKRYFNSLNLAQKHKDNPIHPNNTNGFTIGILYNRVTRYNLILEAGVDYGQQSHDIDIRYDLSNFDPDAGKALAGAKYERNLSLTVNYFAPRVMVGYKYRIAREWHLVAKVGMNRALYNNWYMSDSNSAQITYNLDTAENSYRIARFYAETYFFGEDPYVNPSNRLRPLYNNPIDTWEFYLGTERTFNGAFINRISAGIMFTRTRGRHLSPNLEEYYTTHWGQKVQNGDGYVQKNVSLGLVLGIFL